MVSVSSLYETAPVGGPPQGDYLNAVIVLDTPLPARRLLDLCLEIEQERGRERVEKDGPRSLDLDVILVGESVIDEPGLIVPHPRIIERRFVLEPLAEVWGGGPIPGIPDIRVALVNTMGQVVRRVAGPGWTRRAGDRTGLAAAAAVLAGLAGVAASRILRSRRG